jgi:hypothetical protein
MPPFLHRQGKPSLLTDDACDPEYGLAGYSLTDEAYARSCSSKGAVDECQRGQARTFF